MEPVKREVRSILIIDDDREDYELIDEAVKEIDPEISVTFMSRCDDTVFENMPFDLVLLDINMPQHDGFYWLKAIRDHGFVNLPVIMYTNSMSPAHIAKAYEEGANLYFSKPDTFPSLIKGLSTIIRMDWSNPFSITQAYRSMGRYRTFQA